ncbi:MAG: InlB B-repeat-containing protein [Clostridiaceae bacterium]
MKKELRQEIILLLSVALMVALFIGCSKTEKYTVDFDSFGGSPVESQVVKNGKLVEKPKDPVKEGFTFIEWQNESETYDFNTPVTHDLTLTALYDINEDTEAVLVAFDADNDTDIKTVNIAKGSPISEPLAPIKSGFIFEGWYHEDSEFDFSTSISENILLVAKWRVDKSSSTDKDNTDKNSTNNEKSNNSEKSDSNNNVDSSTKSDSSSDKIRYLDVEGSWYAEGTDDVILKFSLENGTWIYLDSTNFDYYTGEVDLHSGRGGGEYYNDKGYFYSEEIKLHGKTKLVYTKNNKTTTFYRQKNYPTAVEWPYEKLLREINGYYWYLDGYKYAYIRPEVEPWYDHQALSWESENIDIRNGNLIACDGYSSYSDYSKINSQGSSNLHNTLMVNPIEFADSLIKDYKMKTAGNKLYMTVGGKQYTFTKNGSKKQVDVVLSVKESTIAKNVDEEFNIKVQASPFWYAGALEVFSSNESVVRVGSNNHWISEETTTMPFYAVGAGTAKITFKAGDGRYVTSCTVTVTKPIISVTGITLSEKSHSLYKGDAFKLTATIAPSNADNKIISWSSSDTNVATVSSKGEVKAVGTGTAVITVKSDDGSYTDTCTVTVTYKPLSARCSVGYYLEISDGVSEGIQAQVTPTGGSGGYTYYIELYCGNSLLATTTNSTINNVKTTFLVNGTYTAKYTVRDSEGNEVSGVAQCKYER